MAANQTLYFYDLETSGFNPREARVMQFGGQRTDMELQPIGEPDNYLIRLSDDVLPDPDAVLITGITPQRTIAEGLSEAEFLKIFHKQICLAGTIFVGFNSIRFDDEFMRFLHYRNFYDPYEWQWQDGRSKWDLLDVVRMTRALRPEGIEWPFDSKGQPTNRLEYLTSVNKLEHQNAHDALADVNATLAVAKLIRTKQSDLFKFMLKMRDKTAITKLVTAGSPFVYTSGKYDSSFEKTTVVSMLCDHPAQSGAALVFDLRYDPEPFAKMSPEELVEVWRWRKDSTPGERLPVKTLKYNRCPAVAPLGVLDVASQERLKLSPEIYQENYKKLQAVQEKFCVSVKQALEMMDKKQQAKLLEDETEVDSRLYDGFFDSKDKTAMSVVRAAGMDELKTLQPSFSDGRLNALLPLYKVRNYPKSLSDEDRAAWELFRERKLLGGGLESRMSRYFARIGELESNTDLNHEQRYLLEELQLWAQSIMPGEL